MRLMPKSWMKPLCLLGSSGSLLAAGNCLPQNFFADLAGSSVETFILEIIINIVSGALSAGTA